VVGAWRVRWRQGAPVPVRVAARVAACDAGEKGCAASIAAAKHARLRAVASRQSCRMRLKPAGSTWRRRA
jgi:hypothetical protein